MGVRTTLSVAAFVCATVCSAAKPPRPTTTVDPAVRENHPPPQRIWAPPPLPPPPIQAPASVTGLEDTSIPLGITVDQSLIDGGSLPDIIGTTTGFRSASAGSTPNTFTIPAGTTSIRVTAYGGKNEGAASAQSEEWQQITSTIDLASNTYSGYLFYTLSIGTAYTASYSFSGRPLGSASNAGAIIGYNGTATTFTASVSGNTLSLVQNQTVTDQAYLIEFLSATQSSLSLIGTQGAIQNPTGGPAATSAFTLDPEVDLLVLSIQDGRGTSNANDEERGMSRIVVDLEQARASGNVFQITGAGNANTVAYGFTDYDITTGTPVLSSGAPLIGDVTGSASVLQNFTIIRSGQQLSVTRPAAVASGFTALINLEQYRRKELGSAAVFTGTTSASAVLSTFTGALDTSSFRIPDHSQFGVLTLGMTSNQNATGDVENAGSAQIFIDLVQQTTSGSFAVMRASTPDLMVWSNVPFGTMMFGAPGSLSNQSTFAAFTDEYPAVLTFELITNANGSRSLRMTARPTTISNSTPTYQNYRFTAQTSWAGRPLIEVSGVPVGGTLSAGELNPITQVWSVDPADLASLAFTPPTHYSGQGVTLNVRYLALELDIPVNVVRVADMPLLATADRSGPEDTALSLSGAISPTIVDYDGSEIIDRIRISGLPIGHTLSDGTNTFTATAGVQAVDVQAWMWSALSYLPPANYSGSFPLHVDLRIADSDGFSATSDTASVIGQFMVTIDPVNDAPVGGDDTFTMNEDGVLTAQSVTGNDADIDNTNAQLIWSLVSGGSAAANGTLVFNPNGTFNYTPNANFNGTVSFTYGVCDPAPLCDNTNTVTITIAPVNDAPVGGDDAFTMNEDGVLTAQSVTGNDADIDNTNAQLIWSLVNGGSAAANGTLVFNPNGTFNYTPNANFNGTVSFTYGVCDPAPLCDNTNTVTLTITPVNDAPVGGDDTFTMNEDGALTAQSVTGNDADIDNTNAQLIWSLVSGGSAAANGTLVFNPNGTFNYTPNANFNGTVSFTYRVCDPGPACDNTNTVTITIAPVNDAPVGGDDAFTMNEDGALTVQSVTGNDADIDNTNAQLIWSLVSGGSAAANGTLVFNPNGTFNYTPNANYNGTVSFTYGLCDPAPLCDNTNTVTITITPVNDAPTVNDDHSSTLPGVAVTHPVIANDNDALDGSPMDGTSISIVAGPAHGDVTVHANGSITYAPSSGFVGTDSITYRACDQGVPLPARCNTALWVIIVTDAYPYPVPDAFNGTEDLNIVMDVLTNDGTTNGTLVPASVAVTTPPAHGTTSVDADGVVNYTPDEHYNGVDGFTYSVCNTLGYCATTTVGITLAPVNDAPLAMNDTASTDEEVAITVDVQENDTDPYDAPLGGIDATSTSISMAPVHGTADVLPDGRIHYTPDPDHHGVDSLRYTICDIGTPLPALCASATLVLHVAPVNDAPVITDTQGAALDTLHASTPEDSPLTICITHFDVDSDAVQLSVIGEGPGHGTIGNIDGGDACFTFTPDPGYHGADHIELVLCDAVTCDTLVVMLTVEPVNDPPVVVDAFGQPTASWSAATSEDQPVTICLKAFDPENDAVQVTSASNGPLHGALSGLADGDTCFTYTPVPDFHGTDTMTMVVCDIHGACDTVQVVITVLPVNDGPMITGADGMPLDTVYAEIISGGSQQFCFLATDVDGDVLQRALVLAPEHGTVSGLSSAAECFTYTADPDLIGTDTLIVTTCDPQGACASLVIIISLTNQPPQLLDDAASTAMDTDINIAVLDNDSDPEGSSLTVQSATALHGTVTIEPNGTITYSPDNGYCGQDLITYTVCDPVPQCAQANVAVQIECPTGNLPPVLENDEAGTEADTPVDIDVLANDHDPEGDALTITDAYAGQGSVMIHADGTLTYTPSTGFCGTDTVHYTACDTAPLCSEAMVLVQVECAMESAFRIPQGLTPNGDGHNDTWTITGLERYPQASVTVFDRWGLEVFGAAPYRNDWDGRSRNAIGGGGLPDGTYWYILDLNDGSGTQRTGYIHIIH